MKTVFFFLILLVNSEVSAQEVDKNKPAFFYACVDLGKDIHVAQTEVSISDWLGFLNWVEDSLGLEAMNKLMPDLSKINEHARFTFDLFMVGRDDKDAEEKRKWKWVKGTYLIYPLLLSKQEKSDFKRTKRFLDMPITGITYDQATRYMAWMELKINSEDLNVSLSEYKVEVDFIPVAMYDSLFIQSVPGYGLDSTEKATTAPTDSVNIKGCPLFNFKASGLCESQEKRAELYGSTEGSVPVFSFFPGIIGLYNICGNVAEMTSEKGVCYGGSYVNSAKQILNQPKGPYSKPEIWLGFRYVIKVVKKG